MRVMVLVKANKESEAGELPSTELLTAMGKFNQELAKAGIVLAGEGLHPSSKGVRVRFSEGEPAVTAGPFGAASNATPDATQNATSNAPSNATQELVAGFWLWRVSSMEEAIEWAKRAPFGVGAEIEIRPLHEAEDFGARLTPELRAQEERLREEIQSRAERNQRKAS